MTRVPIAGAIALVVLAAMTGVIIAGLAFLVMGGPQ